MLERVGKRREHTKSRSVIKNHNRLGLPPHASLEIMTSHNMAHEEIEEPSLLGLLQTLHLGDEFAVEEEAFLACYRVHPHKGMDAVDWVFAHQTTRHTGVVDHLC